MKNYNRNRINKLIIMQGHSSSGKSSFARQFAKDTDAIISTDDYFMEDGIYKFDIEGLGVEIGIKLLSYEEEAAVSDAARRRIEIGLTENITTDTLKAIIVSVNGVGDPRIINHVVDQMPVKDSRKIRKINSLITPRLKLEGEVTCAKCSETTVLEVPFTTGFFWPEL